MEQLFTFWCVDHDDGKNMHMWPWINYHWWDMCIGTAIICVHVWYRWGSPWDITSIRQLHHFAIPPKSDLSIMQHFTNNFKAHDVYVCFCPYSSIPFPPTHTYQVPTSLMKHPVWAVASCYSRTVPTQGKTTLDDANGIISTNHCRVKVILSGKITVATTACIAH